MKLLTRYIGITVARSYALVLAALLAILSFFDFVRELEDVGKGLYRPGDALLHVALTMPQRAIDMLPVTALLGTIIGLGILANSSELVAMRSAGVSVARITAAALRVAALLVLAAMVMQEFGIPPLEQYAQTRRSLAISGTVGLRTQYGFWSRDEQAFVKIRNILPDGTLSEIDVYQFDNTNRLISFSHAQSAHVENSRYWVLNDITEKRIGDSGVTMHHLQAQRWDTFLRPEQLEVLILPARSLAVSDLYRYSNYLRRSGQNADRYELAFWKKLMLPLTTAAMVALAVPFVFGPLRTRTAAQRVMVGALVGIAFYLANQILDSVGLLYGINAILPALLPPLVAGAVAAWLLRRL